MDITLNTISQRPATDRDLLPQRNKDDAIDDVQLFQHTGHTWSCELDRRKNKLQSQRYNIYIYIYIA